jgi:hypothetical protein
VAIAREFKPATRPVRFTSNPAYLGPDHDEPCPCGSTRRAGDCHVNRVTGRWKAPAYAPLLTGASTGISCGGCYASFTNDCSPKLSNEHWLSKGIVLAAGHDRPVQISGLRWRKGREHVLPASSMGANILCERHNNALWRLDETAISVFATLDHYQEDQRSQPDLHGNEFDLFSGEDLERWLLKLLWGGTAARVFARNAEPVHDLRATANRNMLADYLFRGGSLPPGWGLYVEGRPGELSADANVAVATKSIDGALWSGSVAMGVVEFTFALGPTQAKTAGWKVWPRPRAVCLNSRLDSAQKVLALGWDHGKTTGKGVTFTYHRA